jgi:hypothetical protein
MAMAVETRPELVGKRFLCVGGDEPLDLRDIGRWGWRAGVIRAVTHRDNNHSELTVRNLYIIFNGLPDRRPMRHLVLVWLCKY